MKAQSNAYNDERMFGEETEQNSDEGDLLALTNGNGEPQKSIETEEHKRPANEPETTTIEQKTEEVDVCDFKWKNVYINGRISFHVLQG